MVQSQFFRRKHPKKRRHRATFEPSDSPNLDPIISASSIAQAPTISVPTLRNATQLSQPRLRPRPTVSGYETTLTVPDKETDSRYSAKDLSALRSSTTSVPLPILKPPPASLSLCARPLPDDPPPPVQPNVQVCNQPCPSKLGQCEQSQKDVGLRARLADPFSEEWGRGIEDQPYVHLESDDEIHIDLELGSVDDKLAICSDLEYNEKDDEWHKQLLRRAGINFSSTWKKSEEEEFAQDECIIRDILLTDELDEDESMVGLLRKSVNDVLVLRDNAEHNANGEIEKCTKLNRIVNDSNLSRQKTNCVTQIDIDAEKFYSQFANDMEQLSLFLRSNRVNMLQFRKDRVTRLQQQASFVVDYLKKGVDEFGRKRRSGQGAQIPVDGNKPIAITHPFSGILDNQWNITKLAARFAQWKERFPEDYSTYRGDVGFGRIVGALSTCEEKLDWLISLSSEQRIEACAVVNVVEEAALVLRATWLPTDIQSCEDIGHVLHALFGCLEEGKESELLAAMENRIAIELSAAEAVTDGSWVWKLLNGTLVLAKITGKHCGIQQLLEAIQRVGTAFACNVPLALKNLNWLITSNFGKDFLTASKIKQVEELLQTCSFVRA